MSLPSRILLALLWLSLAGGLLLADLNPKIAQALELHPEMGGGSGAFMKKLKGFKGRVYIGIGEAGYKKEAHENSLEKARLAALAKLSGMLNGIIVSAHESAEVFFETAKGYGLKGEERERSYEKFSSMTKSQTEGMLKGAVSMGHKIEGESVYYFLLISASSMEKANSLKTLMLKDIEGDKTSVSVVVSGSSPILKSKSVSEEEAINDALRKAVGSVLGVDVASSSDVREGKVTKETWSHSKGFVKSYEVIEIKELDVTIKAVVKAHVSRKEFDLAVENARLGGKKSLVLASATFTSKSGDISPFGDGADMEMVYNTTYDGLVSQFHDKGLPVASPHAVKTMKSKTGLVLKKMGQPSGEVLRRFALASAQSGFAGYTVHLMNTVSLEQYIPSVSMYKVKSSITITAIDGTTGQEMSSVTKKGSAMGKSVIDTAEKATKSAMKSAARKFFKGFAQTIADLANNGAEYVVEIEMPKTGMPTVVEGMNDSSVFLHPKGFDNDGGFKVSFRSKSSPRRVFVELQTLFTSIKDYGTVAVEKSLGTYFKFSLITKPN
jgi:hypothetical protein